ncbi:ComEC/Rec2 family competence protein [Caminibacter mediatlanticus]|uniref:ComEC/Rec2-related protein n=1 Tax=Caminibacter mediatlanticus TB-2 TaxID=391592 RepID=A0AAI9AIQ6_9BACT|nr:ComEC/Rec2 family competence protein [Caminibacter mediatlanticus]EDM24325.1 ComEC/Rec2-related protein [Caminibacter mediatlanticus TB-2]
MIFVLILILKLQLSFLSYLNFLGNGYKIVDARVITQYKKKNYYVLKLKNKEVTFYTTSRDDLKNLLNEKLTLTLITKNISFLDYLTTFYAPSFNLKLNPISFIEEKIESQHKYKKISNLYKALYLGEAIDYKTRKELSTLGISYLFALSGLHLGFISLILFLIFSPIYKFFQRYFPYRNRFFDLGILILVVEFLYLYLTSFPPSLIRAYVMEVILFLFAIRLQNIFSLKVLFLTILFSFLIFFTKIFSIGFLLSILGVFYIYLFFRYFRPTFLNGILLSFYMFLVMFIISHSFFGNFNIYQLFSPFINLIFTIFYPISIFMHIIGFGGIFDEIIDWYLHLGDNFSLIKFDIITLILFALISLTAFFERKVFIVMIIMSFSAILDTIF